MDINKMAEDIHDCAVRKGWWEKPRNFGEICLLITSEAVEAHEEYRDGHEMTEIYFAEDGKPEGVPIELADILIRVLDTMQAYGIDPEEAVSIKMLYNESRPYRHGGKKA